MRASQTAKIDYAAARQLLETILAEVSDAYLQDQYRPSAISGAVLDDIAALFASSTQAYREALLGCVLARLADPSVDIARPYASHGAGAFNGRSLDERVVNQFLHDNRIPASKGPYVNVFRRAVPLGPSTRSGVRDKVGFDALLRLIGYLKEASPSDVVAFLRHLVYRFVLLREASEVSLVRIQRLSLEQYDALISRLLATPSGGRFPLLLVVAAFGAIKQRFDLDWDIQVQGIFVPDSASGTGGDITIISAGSVVLAAEVTERMIDRARVVSTFLTKIAPSQIADYLFFLTAPHATDEAREQARRYFAQGHEVNFPEIKTWILMCLTTLGAKGRTAFNALLVQQLSQQDMPGALKVAWNQHVTALASG